MHVPKELLNHVLTYTHTVITGGVHSYLHAVVLVCKPFFAILDHGAVSVLCLACGDEALPREWRVLNGTNGQIRWKVAVTEALPKPACKHTNTETKASTAFLCFGNNYSYSILPPATSRAFSSTTALSAHS